MGGLNTTGKRSNGMMLMLVLLMTSAAMSPSDSRALSNRTTVVFEANLVKIKAVYASAAGDERGFGLIMLEEEGFLYIATPKHVIEDEAAAPDTDRSAERVTVTLYKADQSNVATVVQVHSYYDLALLRIPKPEGFLWNYARLGGTLDPGERLWVLGYDWQWKLKPGSTPIYASGIDDTRIVAYTNVNEGTSGGLLITEHSIVGMIIYNDEEKDRVIAYQFDFISKVILEGWLQEALTPDYYDDAFPYLTVGVNGNIALGLTSIDELAPPLIYGTSLNIDYIFTRDWGLRYTHSEYRASSEADWPLGNESIRFRNDITIDMINIVFTDANTHTPYIRKNLGSHLIYIGFGVGKHNPQVSINGTALAPLDSQSSFPESYTTSFNVLAFGLSAQNEIGNNWTFGFDIGFLITDENYLVINAKDPFEKNSLSDFFFQIGVNMSYSFGKPLPPEKKVLF